MVYNFHFEYTEILNLFLDSDYKFYFQIMINCPFKTLTPN